MFHYDHNHNHMMIRIVLLLLLLLFAVVVVVVVVGGGVVVVLLSSSKVHLCHVVFIPDFLTSIYLHLKWFTVSLYVPSAMKKRNSKVDSGNEDDKIA